MRSQPASSIMANGYRFRNQAEYKTATCQLPHEGSLPNRRRPYKCLETQPTRHRLHTARAQHPRARDRPYHRHRPQNRTKLPLSLAGRPRKFPQGGHRLRPGPHYRGGGCGRSNSPTLATGSCLSLHQFVRSAPGIHRGPTAPSPQRHRHLPRPGRLPRLYSRLQLRQTLCKCPAPQRARAV